MWTKEKLEKAAWDWTFEHPNANINIYADKMKAFLAGCKYIIDNTQKEQ